MNVRALLGDIIDSKGIPDRKGFQNKRGYRLEDMYGSSQAGMEIINTGLRAAMAVMADWKEDTLRVFNDLYQGKKVKDFLPDYGLSQRGVYKLISRNKLREFVEYFHCVKTELEKLKG